MAIAKKEWIRVLKFTLFSASAGIIQAISFTLLYEVLSLRYWLSYLLALILSVVWNFTLNRQFTFKASNNIPVAMMKVAAFYLVFIPISTYGGDWLEQSMGWNGFLVLVLSMLLNFVTEFLYDRYVVFGKSTDTAV